MPACFASSFRLMPRRTRSPRTRRKRARSVPFTPGTILPLSLLCWRQRSEGARRAGAVGLDGLPVRHPRLAAVGGAVGSPRKVIGADVVVADPRFRRANCLLEMHLGTIMLRRTDVVQAVAFVQ